MRGGAPRRPTGEREQHDFDCQLRGGGGYRTLVLALLALAALLAASALTLAPARAQTPGPPASIEISEPLGSLSRDSEFQLTATVTDANGNPVSDGTAVTWSSAVSGSATVLVSISEDTSTIAGKAYARYLVVNRGTNFVTVTSGSITALQVLRAGESPGAQPPDPSSVSLSSGPDTARTAGRLVMTARITDANGAPVPDDTPVAWEMAAAYGANAVFTPVSVDRATANGTASATYAVTSASAVNVLATARAGAAVRTRLFGVPLTWPAQFWPAEFLDGVTLTSSAPSWKLLKIGETATITATVTDANGEPVSDGTAITFGVSQGGRVTQITLLSADTQTTSGSASAAILVVDTEGLPSWVTASAIDRSGTLIFSNLGSYPKPPNDLALSLHLPADSDNIVPTDSTLRVGADLTYTGQGQTVHVSDGTLRVAGSQEWESGRRRLTIAGQTVPTYSATNPDTCKGVSSDGQTDWACAVELDDATIHIPAGTPDGKFTISGVITVNGREYRDSLEVTVVAPNTIDEVAEVQFDFAEQVWGANRGEPYPANVPVGGETKFRLKILNENGVASAEGSIGSILLTTSAGTLSTRIGGGCVGGGGAACQIPVSAVTAANADQLDVILTHPGPNKSGRGEVRASVLAIDGETFAPPALNVSFAGEVASLAISEPSGSLLSAATDADDNRDVLKLTVSAADAAGNDVELPYRAPHAVVRGPDGKVVTNGVSVVWTEDGDDSDDAHDRFTRNTANAVEATVGVTAAAESPLKLGVYTLELRTAGQSATREFTVVGGTDSVALSEPTGELRVNGTISLTATLRDAEGSPVPDGTPVSWAERSTGQSAVLVRLATDGATTDGASTATFFAVGAGTAVVSAESGGVSDVALLRIAAAPPAGGAAEREPQLGESLSTQGAPGLATWLGAAQTSASALLDALSGIDSIQLWSIDRWLRYSRGADDFAIQPGAVLWLSG